MLRSLLAAAFFALAGCAGLNPVAGAADTDAWTKYTPWNSANPDVKKTGSGLEYVVLASGPAGGATPAENTMVEINYEGRLNATGKTFDSSFERGETAVFPVGGVIPGFSEALKLMHPGDAWLVYIPSAIGYGEEGAGDDIPPNSDLVFELEFKRPIESDAAAWKKHVPWNSASPDVKKTGTGLEYIILENAPAGAASTTPGSTLEVWFEAHTLATDEFMTSSFQDGEPAYFPLDDLTPGFSEVMKLMKPGDRWLVLMPQKLTADPDAPDEEKDPDLVIEILLTAVHAE